MYVYNSYVCIIYIYIKNENIKYINILETDIALKRRLG